jgi:DNA-directed RNA polymerase subunit F
MTVISMKPIPLASVGNYLPDVEDSQPVKNYLKEFTKLSESKALELIEKLQGLNSIKLRESHFVKIADYVPLDAEDVHKVCNDVSLDEKEVTAILDIVKEY